MLMQSNFNKLLKHFRGGGARAWSKILKWSEYRLLIGSLASLSRLGPRCRAYRLQTPDSDSGVTPDSDSSGGGGGPDSGVTPDSYIVNCI